jgi:hypothetical protein
LGFTFDLAGLSFRDDGELSLRLGEGGGQVALSF